MRALISVSDKTGIAEFAAQLHELGVEIISTGGTLKVLKENGIPAVPIDDVTQFPEMLDGRVKTLHPKIHGGLLALRANSDHMQTCADHGIELIDIVVVNLYPFESTVAKPGVEVADAIEQIDIGGPSMLRSAAKNYQSVAVVVSPDRYSELIKELTSGEISQALKSQLAGEAFQHTAYYDGMISRYFQSEVNNGDTLFPDQFSIPLKKYSDLRYGENPHQQAAFYRIPQGNGLPSLVQHHGKELSYNNIVDLEAAWHIVKEFNQPAAVVIKHSNPCGAALGHTMSEAYEKAHAADPVSAFGSIIGVNHTVDMDTASQISETFVEAVIAPHFDKDALELLSQKPSIRLIELSGFYQSNGVQYYKHVTGGILVQEPDNKGLRVEDLEIVTSAQPDEETLEELLFAFKCVKHVKSNAIFVSKEKQSLGVGAGQMSRIDSVAIALEKAGDSAKGAVLASDAFFPFKDSVEQASKAGITAIIQPGGSKRDQESIDACNEHGIVMAFTGVRHFKH
jgi:phosphoribosylaminoimidazolecarboxamide formyltransferase/IMP cyclohydrolase